ncbi:4-(cytidine 5'-diphospho)-2-C-methyl-D-erythritol kinase [Aneurinibacillus aneurinilyticus]|jgi:4-diphosphocytidyl-2-C-methyl-D-erythritol kinase|uniref:4-diphosphocytidyl-2-C-methyl-D-erythritol kinase n=3 Tax=Aneurinibacillus aneurinilyticus TaxID=1391 RepID=A0A848CX96_ANEAE|nr:4-(cytidine 5'-diphospho)-2-C-methyl-D-erythritol kinase [Aneurinibacillus aneurinilyticus ATCC 12856]NMF00086.1 4-(cytidine 5'-diphospho)-2-C-methyl-D-erythritol kinase [Aneurinibacillus aneurinilyticus]
MEGKKDLVNDACLMVKAPAKINLTLDVLAKRPDGYHEIEMVMTTIDLADRLTIYPREEDKITLDCTVSYLPLDDRNHVYQAARLVKERFGIKSGVHIHIDKQIPIAAGLAGGSSDAAATIKGLNRLWDLGMNVEEMAELGSHVGSDVSFCVYGGTALARGRGEKIEPLPSPPSCWVILAKPPIGVSTGEVYGALRIDEWKEERKSAEMIAAIQRSDFGGVCRALGNHLESVTLEMHPQVRQIKERMLRFGADGVLMSGSGPTVFALAERESRMNRIYNGLRGFCKEVYAVRILGENNR